MWRAPHASYLQHGGFAAESLHLVKQRKGTSYPRAACFSILRHTMPQPAREQLAGSQSASAWGFLSMQKWGSRQPWAACSQFHICPSTRHFGMLCTVFLVGFFGGVLWYREIPVANFAPELQIRSAVHSLMYNTCGLWCCKGLRCHKLHMTVCLDLVL